MIPFTQCKKAELLDKSTGQKIIAGVSVTPPDNIVIALPADFKPVPNELVRIQFLDAVLGVVTCLCFLSRPRLTADKKYVICRCQVREQLHQLQRREDIKVPLETAVEITHIDSGIRAMAIAHNISAGGVYLSSSLAVQKGDQLSFQLQGGAMVIPLTAEVLRIEFRSDLNSIGYGCRFVRLSPLHEAHLRAYVFQEDRRQRRQRKS